MPRSLPGSRSPHGSPQPLIGLRRSIQARQEFGVGFETDRENGAIKQGFFRGAVGSVVGQLAKLGGLRAVGIAGGAEKCRYVTEELGFDACVDYREAQDAKELAKRLRAAAPGGVDAHFENVGGDVLNAVMSLLNPFARVAICGLISDYNNDAGAVPRSAIRNPAMFLVARLKMQGFIVSDHLDLWPQGLTELGALLLAGKLKYRESVANDLASAPEAFIGLLRGKNFGKQVVKLI